MEKSLATTPEEKEGVRRIRRRRILSFILFLSYVPSVGVIHTWTGSDTIAITVGLMIFVTIGGLWLLLALAKCPRCKKLFFSKWYWSNGFSSKCLHCGLSIKR